MIFVAIAAYCDPHLEHTVRNAVQNARYPEKLVFGIVEQSPTPSKGALQLCAAQAKLRYLHVTPDQSRGLSWARALVFGLYGEETFLLQVDSHTVFDWDWDVCLIDQMVDLSSSFDKPVLSTYPLGFHFNEAGKPIRDTKAENDVFIIRPNEESKLDDDNALLFYCGTYIESARPVLGCHLAGGFLFTFGHFINEVPHDPLLYHRDEQSMAVRAFTHGWNILHIARVPVQHLYKRPEQSDETLHWFPLWEAERDIKYYVHMYRAQNRFADMVYGRRSLGRYGLGAHRSLEAFAELSGIDYRRRIVVPAYRPDGYFADLIDSSREHGAPRNK